MPYDVEELRTAVLQFRDRYEQFGAHEGAHALTRVLNILDAAPVQTAPGPPQSEPAPRTVRRHKERDAPLSVPPATM